MDFHIIANFTSNRDYKGSLKMYDSNGNLVFGPVEALGRGTSCEENDWDHTKWWLTNADTPTGSYTAWIVGPGSPVSSYGPYERVSMDPISGNALIAEENGRYGFMIHGGDPETNTSATWYPLRPTYGCIRISNSNQAALIKKIKEIAGDNAVGKVTVNNI